MNGDQTMVAASAKTRCLQFTLTDVRRTPITFTCTFEEARDLAAILLQTVQRNGLDISETLFDLDLEASR